MDYTLSNVYKKINLLADKMGSDYFPLILILEFFKTACYDFIGERLKVVEKTQEISDDIRPIVLPAKLPVIEDPNNPGKSVVGVPDNYLRLLAYTVVYPDKSKCRRADLKRHAEYELAQINPNQKPTKEYPIILLYDSYFLIDAGGVIPETFEIFYAKKPVFSEPEEQDTIIVNLPDDAIEKILKMTVTNLFLKTGDDRLQTSYELQEAYRKIFK